MSRLTFSDVGVELLDNPRAPDAAVTRSLSEIAIANRWLGAQAALLTGLERVVGRRHGTVTLLDVGTGAGDLPASAVRWADNRNIQLRCIGIELHRAAAALANRNGLVTAVASGESLPFADDACDVVICSQLLHHFDDHSSVTLLREMRRVARLGGVVVDLRQVPLAAAGFRLFGAAMRFDRVTVSDGIVSMRRGRNAVALNRLAIAAGLPAVESRHRPVAHVLLTWRELP